MYTWILRCISKIQSQFGQIQLASHTTADKNGIQFLMSTKVKSEQQPCSDGEKGPLLQNHLLPLLAGISPSSPTPYLGSQPSCRHHPGSSAGQEPWDTQNRPSAGHTPPGNSRYKLRSWNLKSRGHQWGWARARAHARTHARTHTHTHTHLPFPVIFKMWSAVSDGSGIPVPWNFKILIWGDIFKME